MNHSQKPVFYEVTLTFDPQQTDVSGHPGDICSHVCVHLMRFLSFNSLFAGVFQSTNEAVFAVEFNPSDSTNIITCGKSHVYFWTLSAGQFTKKQGIFGVSLTESGDVVLSVFSVFNVTTALRLTVCTIKGSSQSSA